MKQPHNPKKKILLTSPLADLLQKKDNFFGRVDTFLQTALSGREILRIHREENIDLIVAGLEMPDMQCEDLFRVIRADDELCSVSVIIVGRDNPEDRDRSRMCRANAFFTLPLDIPVFRRKVRQLLEIAPRKDYRAALAVGIQGKFRDKPLPFSTINISGSGMLIETEERLSKGEKLFFSFFLRNGAHIYGYGQIARMIQVARVPLRFHYGVTFTEIDPDAKAAIDGMFREKNG